MDNKKCLIDEITRLEWKQFQAVENQGGRASCQENYDTFYIMRCSQFMVWTEGVLESYLEDLQNAEQQGWNLLSEKYARMMKSTSYDEYIKIEHLLPKRNDSRIAVQEKIIEQHIKWEEEFSARYPEVALKGRPIYTKDDSKWNTSIETYLRGELGTYSDKTIDLLWNMCSNFVKEGRNIPEETIRNTIILSNR